MCSMPTTLPLGPVYKQKKITAVALHIGWWETCKVYTALTILAKQAVRYPLPEPTSSADAPSVSLSLNSSKA